jgi:Ca-activated chloride channel family protein
MRLKLAVLTFFAFFSAQAQQPTQMVESKGETLSVDVQRVNVLFTVADRKGKLITNLRREDFNVFEDDRVQQISNFSTETDLPLNIAVLIDSSGSVRDKLRFERQAATKFFYSALRQGKDKVFIMSFDTAATLLQDYTDDPALLSESVRKIIPGGSTSLYDAVFEAAAKLAGQKGRRVIIVLSDGLDNSSHASLAKILEVAQKEDVIVYTISTNSIDGDDPHEQKIGDANLRRLGTETGGRAFVPAKVGDLLPAFVRISDELRSQYSLAYGPTNASRDGTFRQIRVVAAQRSYRIRCRTGYFAPGRDLALAGR